MYKRQSYNRVTTWAILQEKNNGQKFVYFNTHLDNDGKTARKEGVHTRMKYLAIEKNMSLRDIVNEAMKEYLEKHEK